jgi:hypothetical protein
VLTPRQFAVEEGAGGAVVPDIPFGDAAGAAPLPAVLGPPPTFGPGVRPPGDDGDDDGAAPAPSRRAPADAPKWFKGTR